MDKLKKGDFVELEYTGKVKENNAVFDTTDADVARKHGIFTERMPYGPIVICIGEHQILKGIDNFLEGKEPGKRYSIDIPPEEGFGKKDAKLLKIVPINVFTKQRIMPEPGLQVNIDGAIGTIRSIAGGRTVVDFNHPLSSKDLVYDVNVKKVITDNAEKLQSYLSLAFNLKRDMIKVSVENNNAKVGLPVKLPEQIAGKLSEHLMNLTGLKGVSFEQMEKEPKKA